MGQPTLPGAVEAAVVVRKIHYLHLPELGGRRRVTPTAAPSVWRNKSFKAYAEFMKTAEFESGIARLLSLATKARTCIMCAEALWWRCHRALIADFLKAAGHNVLHILSAAKLQPHPYTSAASIIGGELSYEPRDTATPALGGVRPPV